MPPAKRPRDWLGEDPRPDEVEPGAEPPTAAACVSAAAASFSAAAAPLAEPPAAAAPQDAVITFKDLLANSQMADSRSIRALKAEALTKLHIDLPNLDLRMEAVKLALAANDLLTQALRP